MVTEYDIEVDFFGFRKSCEINERLRKKRREERKRIYIHKTLKYIVCSLIEKHTKSKMTLEEIEAIIYDSRCIVDEMYEQCEEEISETLRALDYKDVVN